LQFNNLQATAENMYHASPAERWAYFLQNADKLTSAELRRLFSDEEISEAVGVLEMISRTPDSTETAYRYDGDGLRVAQSSRITMAP